MTTKTKWFCRIKKGVRFTTGFFVLCGMISAAWLQLGFPVPATAEDVRKLTKGQAEIGIKVQLQAERDLRREINDIEWKLLQIDQSKHDNGLNNHFKEHLLKQKAELQAQLDMERSQREAYKEQLQRLEEP